MSSHMREVSPERVKVRAAVYLRGLLHLMFQIISQVEIKLSSNLGLVS